MTTAASQPLPESPAQHLPAELDVLAGLGIDLDRPATRDEAVAELTAVAVGDRRQDRVADHQHAVAVDEPPDRLETLHRAGGGGGAAPWLVLRRRRRFRRWSPGPSSRRLAGQLRPGGGRHRRRSTPIPGRPPRPIRTPPTPGPPARWRRRGGRRTRPIEAGRRADQTSGRPAAQLVARRDRRVDGDVLEAVDVAQRREQHATRHRRRRASARRRA